METINNIQKKIYEKINKKYTIVDVPEESITLPFIRIAECNYNVEKCKGSKIKSYDIKQEIHIWSDYEGKREVNALMGIITEMIEDIDFEGNVICNECVYSNVIDLENYKQGILQFDIKIDK